MRRGILGVALVALSLVLSASFASAEYELHHYSPGGQYMNLDIVEWDGDPTPELLAGNWVGNRAEIWDYDPVTGEMVLVASVPMPGNMRDLNGVDIDKDGDLDIVGGIRFYGTYVLRNDGGTWATIHVDPIYCAENLIVDFDGDGNLDIYSCLDYLYLRIFYGDGTGGFTQGPAPLPDYPDGVGCGMTVCDFNFDGRPDLIGTVGYYHREDSQVRAYPNLSTPGHPAWGASLIPLQSLGPMWACEPSVADFDGNGYFDHVNATSSGPRIFWGHGDGVNYWWTPGDLLDEYEEPLPLPFVGDLNDDGNADVVVGSSEGVVPHFNGLRMYYGDGAGHFRFEEYPMDHGCTNSPHGLRLGDLNGDGRTDIAVTRWMGAQPKGFDILFRYPDVTLDLHPGSCPNPLSVNKNGVIPAALLASANFDVHEIDLSSITLMGVPPKRTSFADVGTVFRGVPCDCSEDGPDGIEDITLKFSAPAVLEALGEVHVGDVIPLTLTGTLLDGTPFEASDCMKIVGPKDKVSKIPGEDDTAAPDEIPISFDMTVVSGPAASVQRVGYDLPDPAEVTLGVYDVQGRLIRRLVQAAQPAGSHVVDWDAAGLPSGVYFYRITAGERMEAMRVTIIH
jgi:hypothetical protein